MASSLLATTTKQLVSNVEKDISNAMDVNQFVRDANQCR